MIYEYIHHFTIIVAVYNSEHNNIRLVIWFSTIETANSLETIHTMYGAYCDVLKDPPAT